MSEGDRVKKTRRQKPTKYKEAANSPVSVKDEKASQLPERFERNTAYKNITGTEFKNLGTDLVVRGSSPLPLSDISKKQDLTLEAMQELKPKDYVEGMLCSQLALLHVMGMEFLNRSVRADMRCHQDPDLNNGIKLLRLQHETLEALSRYRRKGEQKVIVQHVQVNDGGKAIVGGNMVAGGGE